MLKITAHVAVTTLAPGGGGADVLLCYSKEASNLASARHAAVSGHAPRWCAMFVVLVHVQRGFEDIGDQLVHGCTVPP